MVRPFSIKSFQERALGGDRHDAAAGRRRADRGRCCARGPSGGQARRQTEAKLDAKPEPKPEAKLDVKPEPRAVAVAVRVGEHDDFTRLKFEWPQSVAYRVESDAGRAKIAFDKPAQIDLPALRKRIAALGRRSRAARQRRRPDVQHSAQCAAAAFPQRPRGRGRRDGPARRDRGRRRPVIRPTGIRPAGIRPAGARATGGRRDAGARGTGPHRRGGSGPECAGSGCCRCRLLPPRRRRLRPRRPSCRRRPPPPQRPRRTRPCGRR